MRLKCIFVCVLIGCFALTGVPIGRAMDSIGGIPSGPSAAAGSGASATLNTLATGYGIGIAACIPVGLMLQAAIVGHLEHRDLTQTEAWQTVTGCLFPPLIVYRWIEQFSAPAKNKTAHRIKTTPVH